MMNLIELIFSPNGCLVIICTVVILLMLWQSSKHQYKG